MKKLFFITIFFLLPFSAQAALTDGLVSFWSLDDTTDATSTNDLTNNNSVTFVTGKVGNAADFESSSSQYLSISDASQSGLEPSEISIAFWYKPESCTSEATQISKWDSSATWSYAMKASNGACDNLDAYVSDSSSNLTHIRNAWASTGVWAHIVFTYDNTSGGELWIDGSSVGTDTSTRTIFNGNAPFAIGAAYGTSPARYFDGIIDEVGVWDHALSQSEIDTLLKSGADEFIKKPFNVEVLKGRIQALLEL